MAKVLVKASGIRVMLGILGTILGLPYLLLEMGFNISKLQQEWNLTVSKS